MSFLSTHRARRGQWARTPGEHGPGQPTAGPGQARPWAEMNSLASTARWAPTPAAHGGDAVRSCSEAVGAHDRQSGPANLRTTRGRSTPPRGTPSDQRAPLQSQPLQRYLVTMPPGQVPIWVPLVVALIGLLGVLATQVLSGRREDRRWERERDREDSKRKTDRQIKQADKWYERKLDAYSRVISSLEAWGWKLYPLSRDVLKGSRTLTDGEREELARMRELALDALAPMNLYAPDTVREKFVLAMTSLADFTRELLKGEETIDELRERRRHSREMYKDVRKAIRDELGTNVP